MAPRDLNLGTRWSCHNKAALPREFSPSYQLIGGWVSNTADLDALENT